MPRVRKNDKRERLIRAADTLIYQNTFHTTTLADIAKEADVPLGNVYYYFKTKEAIMAAVIAERAQDLKELFRDWEKESLISDRLNSLIQHYVGQSEDLARFGGPIGSLCQELGKQGGPIASLAAKLMGDILKWAEEQFKLAGRPAQETESLAEHLLSSLEGMALLTLTFKDTGYVEKQSATLKEWVREKTGKAQAEVEKRERELEAETA